MGEISLEGKLGQSCRDLRARLKSSNLPLGVSAGEGRAQMASQRLSLAPSPRLILTSALRGLGRTFCFNRNRN